MFTPEMREKAREAKKHAIPKSAYGAAIKNHGEECWGVNPAVSDCGGNGVIDGTCCRLYHVNTVFKRRKATQTTLKRAIRAECKFCVGGDLLHDCCSLSCKLFPFGPGAPSSRAEEIHSAGS